jgi:hypothetical protein
MHTASRFSSKRFFGCEMPNWQRKKFKRLFSSLTITPSFSGPINGESMADQYSEKKNF